MNKNFISTHMNNFTSTYKMNYHHINNTTTTQLYILMNYQLYNNTTNNTYKMN